MLRHQSKKRFFTISTVDCAENKNSTDIFPRANYPECLLWTLFGNAMNATWRPRKRKISSTHTWKCYMAVRAFIEFFLTWMSSFKNVIATCSLIFLGARFELNSSAITECKDADSDASSTYFCNLSPDNRSGVFSNSNWGQKFLTKSLMQFKELKLHVVVKYSVHVHVCHKRKI